MGGSLLPTRKAADLIGADKDTTLPGGSANLNSMESSRMTKRGYLGFEGQGQAPRWRLTEVGLRGERPTHEFLKLERRPNSPIRT